MALYKHADLGEEKPAPHPLHPCNQAQGTPWEAFSLDGLVQLGPRPLPPGPGSRHSRWPRAERSRWLLSPGTTPVPGEAFGFAMEGKAQSWRQKGWEVWEEGCGVLGGRGRGWGPYLRLHPLLSLEKEPRSGGERGGGYTEEGRHRRAAAGRGAPGALAGSDPRPGFSLLLELRHPGGREGAGLKTDLVSTNRRKAWPRRSCRLCIPRGSRVPGLPTRPPWHRAQDQGTLRIAELLRDWQ